MFDLAGIRFKIIFKKHLSSIFAVQENFFVSVRNSKADQWSRSKQQDRGGRQGEVWTVVIKIRFPMRSTVLPLTTAPPLETVLENLWPGSDDILITSSTRDTAWLGETEKNIS